MATHAVTQQAEPLPNPLDPNCPTRLVLDRIGDKWTVLVVLVLSEEGPMRFTQLREKLGGVAPKVLTQTLRAMERDGMLDREVFAEVPPKVVYQLTPLGLSLDEPLASIRHWAERNVGAVLAARRRHDQAAPAAK